MDAKTVPKEKPKFAPPIARAGKTGMNEMKNKREVRAEEWTAKPAKRPRQCLTRPSANRENSTGKTPLGILGAKTHSEVEEMSQAVTRREEEVQAERSNTGHGTGLSENKIPKKTGRKRGMNSRDGAALGEKREKSYKPRSEKGGEKTEGVQEDGKKPKKRQKVQVMEKGRESRGKAQLLTAEEYDQLFDSVLDSSTLDLMKDAKAMLTEVELMQARIDLETCSHTDTSRAAGSGMKKSSVGHTLCSSQESESLKETTEGKPLHREERSRDLPQFVRWVQCSRADCGKWRRLGEDVDPSVLPDDWICQQNPDPLFRSCLAPEETWSECSEEEFFYSLVPGSLIWAQQNGYPWWPAIVERDPDSNQYLEFRKKSDVTPYKCHVTYLGAPVCRAWVPCSRIKAYADQSKEEVFNQNLQKRLKDAVRMSKEALKLPLKRRLVNFGFRTRYVSEGESSEEDSDVAEVLALFSGNSRGYCSSEDVKSQKKRRLKRGNKSSLSEREERAIKKTHKERRGGERKRVKRNKEGAGTTDEDSGVVTEQTEVTAEVDPLVVKEETSSLGPLFSLPRENEPTKNADTAELQNQDQTVPQSTMETTSDMSPGTGIHSEGEQKDRVAEEERGEKDRPERGGEDGVDVEGDEEGDEEEAAPKPDDEGGFLDTDIGILAYRDEVLKHLSCEEDEQEEEEDGNDFTLMLFEEEEWC